MTIRSITDLTAVIVPAAGYTPPVVATGSMTVTGAGAGDGILGLNIDGQVSQITVSAAETATAAAARLTAIINANESKLNASEAAGVITINSANPGSAGNAINIADASTDTGFTVVVVDVDGGADPVGSPHSEPMVRAASTSLASSITFPEALLKGGASQIQLMLKTNINWEVSGFAGTPYRGAQAIVSRIIGDIYGLPPASGNGIDSEGGGASIDTAEDMDNDGEDDTFVAHVTQDSDSVNIDVDGDGEADIVIPK